MFGPRMPNSEAIAPTAKLLLMSGAENGLTPRVPLR